jgi:hypothetical protein
MAITFEQTYKLANLILTIPAAMALVKRSLSALRRIKTYLCCSQDQDGVISVTNRESLCCRIEEEA